MSSQLKGIVAGILSGDSLIVRFVDNVQTQVICLEHLVAPKFGRSDGTFPDEPHGYASWEYLRDLCIGKRVIVHSNNPSNQTRTHPAFGPLTVTFTKIELYETQEDIGILACQNGWAKLRETKSVYPKHASYIAELTKAQEAAQAAKRGIWSETPGFVRQLPQKPNVEQILTTREFDCNIDGIKAATILSVFLLPNHENIYLNLAGCKVCYFKEDDPIREESKKDSINKFLNRKLRIRITSYLESNFQSYQNQANEIPSFVGCIITPKMDLAVADSIKKGYATFYKKTADQCLDPNLYIHRQLLAQKEKAGFWAKNEPQSRINTNLQQMNGIVTSVRGSSGLYVLVEGQRKVIYFNDIHVPRFSTTVGCESNGFEAREFLRQNYRQKYFTIEIEAQFEDHLYGTISMKGKSINEDLVEKGLATVDKDPVCGVPSSKHAALVAAEERAKAAHVGVHASVTPDPFKFTDLTYTKNLNDKLNEYKGHRFHCIIEHILSTTRYTVLLTEEKVLIRVALNGLLPIAPNDHFGHDAKAFCMDNFLNTEAEIEILSLDEHTGTFYVNMYDSEKKNIAAKILMRGYSEIRPKILKSNEEKIPQELIDAQDKGKSFNEGLWQDKTRHLQDLQMGTVYPVSVVCVSTPTNIVIQHNGEALKTIAKELADMKLDESRFTEIPLKNDCLVYHVKNQSFRVRIEQINQNEKTATVRLIDYCTSTEAKFDDLYKLPPNLYTIPPQGRQVVLAGLQEVPKSPEKTKEDTRFIYELIQNACLYMHLVSDKDNDPSVILLDREKMEEAGSLSQVIIQKRMATYQEVPNLPPQFNNIFEILKNVKPE
ncbi:Tudor domain containing protein [Trichomonas vaginalis G3]|uniref:Tudor domain containing protein n=1 Tax=Trichomonas vaginalis (strain ATCC PRA-98 / G3) TaxID=412133 RepID=A2FN11_TRIV3|nr:gamete generation protein family [Trichomonas vaginalis G3]EAX93709.1 Tudor domain containing protein [Trichomonas vaginalis G3]KAI5504731.1 gamete generation protein family [Trichomonas vaginalis G3]|eukprot:XP_001306639.1 Tudor domain containing protein [Trichomonas vaginalis G3]